MSNNKRIFAGIILFLAVISGVAPLAGVLGLIFTLRYSRYWEILVAGFVFELLYGGGSSWGFLPAPMFSLALITFLLVAFFRAKLRTA
jgi:hypothetical protein